MRVAGNIERMGDRKRVTWCSPRI